MARSNVPETPGDFEFSPTFLTIQPWHHAWLRASYRGDINRRSNSESTKLVNRYEAICIEDLNVKGLARTKLAKSFSDAAMGEFRRRLEYKCLWNRKTLVVIDRFFPSSKMCNRCGALNDRLALSDREWDCDCGSHHRRDFLAACNVRDEGLRILAAGQAGEVKRSGSRCKTRAIGLSASN